MEWGYGGEGGVPSKDPIKIKDRMFDIIDLKDDDDEIDEIDYIPILIGNTINDINED